MNYLQSDQIQYQTLVYPTDNDPFKIAVISHRLAKLMFKKIKSDEWHALWFPMSSTVINPPGFQYVLISPSKGAILLVRDKIFMFGFNRKIQKWQSTF